MIPPDVHLTPQETGLIDIPASVRFYVDLIVILGGIGGWFAAIFVRLIRSSMVTQKAMAEAVGPISIEIEAQAGRITKLESDVSHMPDTASWLDLRDRISRVEGGIQKIEQQTLSIGEMIERIERPLNVLIDEKLKAGK